MSDIVEKTLSSFHDLISGSQSNHELPFLSKKTRSLQNVIDLMTNVRTKHDADVIVKKEFNELQEQLSKPGVKPFQVRECLLRAIYCEMLGYSASFVYIHAIKEADRTKSLVDKRIGYLAASLFLNKSHELVILIINTIQKDLKSTNTLEICLALTASTYLVGSDVAATILDRIEETLTHPKELVRKKAVLVLNHFLRQDTKNYFHLYPKLKSCIGDSDPEVVSVALNALSTIVKNDVSSCGDLVCPLVEILKQVIDRKLPIDFDYHGVPSPWMQIEILKLFRLLGRLHRESDSAVRSVLAVTLEQLNVIDDNVTGAVLYECILTIVTIANNDLPLLEAALMGVERFLCSNATNLKYMGLKALAYIVRYIPSNALVKYQSTIVECIHHTDSSVKRKALDVLFELTSSINIEVLFSKMMEYQRDVADEHGRKEILERISHVVDLHRPNHKWFLDTANTLLLEAGRSSISLPRTIKKIKELLNGNCSNDDVRVYAVTSYIDCLERRRELELSDDFLHLSIWTLSCCRDLISHDKTNTLLGILSAVANEYVLNHDVAIIALTVLRNFLVYSDNVAPYEGVVILENCLCSNDSDIRYRTLEITRILKNLDPVRAAFSCYSSSSFRTKDNVQLGSKNVNYDWTLSFTDSYVIDHLKSGSSPYKARSLRIKCDNDVKVAWPSALSASSCEPFTGLLSGGSSLRTRLASVSSVSAGSGSRQSQEVSGLKVKSGSVMNVWSEEGWYGGRPTNIVKQSTSIQDGDHVVQKGNLDNSEDLLAKALFGNIALKDETTRENQVEDSSRLETSNKAA